MVATTHNKTVTGEDWLYAAQCGTAFPTSPVDGQNFYRTDHRVSYFYDNGLSVWLSVSVHEIVFGCSADTAATAALKFGETATSRAFDTVVGYLFDFPAKCVGMALTMPTSGTCTVEVFDGASAVSGSSSALSLSAATANAIETLASTTITAKHIISVGVTSGTIKAGSRGVARFRRAET